MKLKKWKRLCGLLLAAVLVGSSFMQYTGVARAEGEEPSYDAGTCILKYEDAEQTISAQSGGNVWYDSIAADQTYYVSFTAKSTDTFYFNYKGSEGRLVIKTAGYGLLGVADTDDNQLWGNINTGLDGEDGVKVTLCSESTKTTLWINGEKVEENISLTTSAAEKVGKPQVSWAVADMTLSDIKVWTVNDEPVYNAETDTLKFEANSETISAKSAGSVWYDSIAADQTYYVSFTAKSTDTFYFNYKGSEGRLVIKTAGYGLLGVADTDDNQLWGNINTGLDGTDGVKVTLCSESTKTTLWINGEKVEENISLTTSAAEKAGKPQVSWAVADTTMSYIKVWTAKDGAEEPPVSDEPVYNAETDTLKYMSTSEIVSAGTAGQSWGVTIPGDTTYFGTFKVVTTGSIWFRYRGTADDTAGRMLLDQKQCGFYGLVQNMWPQGDRGLSTDGIKVTFRSEPDKTTIWINGEKLADDAAMATTGQVGVPWVTWAATADATITDIAFWKTKDANDEPVYDETKDKQYNITGVAEGCTYAGGELTVPAEKGAGVQTELPSNAAYYMTMRVKTDNYVNIGTRVGSLIHIEKVGYSFDGTTENTWVSDKETFAKLATGVKITIYSDTVGFKIWVDDEKAIERTYSTANSSAKPDIPWSFASEVTASDIQIWTLNVAELAGHSITLDGNIGVNFYMNLGAAINPEEAVMKFTLPDGSTRQVTGVSTDKGYQYTCEVAAKEMTKEIKAQVVAGDAVSKEYTYSVKDYADTILSDTTTYAEEIPLVKAMLNYGAYAQTYFGYNTEVLANASLEDTEKDVSSVSAETLDSFKKSEQSNTAVALAGARLILESETTLKLYFKLADGADVKDYSFASGGKALTPEKSGTYYYVAIRNIDAKNLDTDYTVTVTSEESTLDVTYSPMTYCYNVLKSYTGNKEEALKNVVRALYLYNSAANVYFPA